MSDFLLTVTPSQQYPLGILISFHFVTRAWIGFFLFAQCVLRAGWFVLIREVLESARAIRACAPAGL